MVIKSNIAPERVRLLQSGRDMGGPVIYWMTREQRVADNWGLILAQGVALENRRSLQVVFCLVPDYPGANIRHYGFMLQGLQEVQQDLEQLAIPFVLLIGSPPETLPRYLAGIKAACLVSDFDPLHIKRLWQQGVAARIECPFYEVDGHNIVPCLHASSKQEYAAHTLRPKITRKLATFLTDFPALKVHPYRKPALSAPPDWHGARKQVADHSVPEIDWLQPGAAAAHERVKHFIRVELRRYSRQRNDPNLEGQSNISPYLHFGQIAPQRVALLVKKATSAREGKEAFLEELIVRRELADNFCWYNGSYDSFAGFPAWARKTLDEHRSDRREYLYSSEEFENGMTHDELWNAAQRQMMQRGKMHGYMRMYWAKKILEWSRTPEDAMAITIYLNDRYELDGRDPNGYAGIAWSIGGVHDRAWRERPVFGKIRFMSHAGCARKFDVKKYCARWLG